MPFAKFVPNLPNLPNLCAKKNLLKLCIQKSGGQMVDEVDHLILCSQFNHHFTSSFCTDILLAKSHKAQL